MTEEILTILAPESNVSPRYYTFIALPPRRVGIMVSVRDGDRVITGKIVESNWKGEHRIDTVPEKEKKR
jgi:hypothetical protein